MRQDVFKYSFFVLLLCLGFVAALGTGVINIPLSDTVEILIHRMTGMFTNPLTQGVLGDVIWQLRMPRFFAACLAGAGLAVCGVVVQAVVRNPLADPYILGISSGAGLGATAAVALRLSRVLGQDSMGLFAFLGALLASLLILLLASRSRQKDSFHLLLVGLALNVICSAGISLFVALAADEAGIQTITYWLMGSLLQVQWHGLLILTVVVLLGVVFFCTQQKILDLLLLDDDTVLTMGLRLQRYRQAYVMLSAAIVGVIVYETGMIGFVGLIVPHIVRRFFGSSHRRVLIFSALFGALFLCWADVLGRILLPGMDVPIGIMAALFGGPVFLGLLCSRRYGFGR